MTSSLLYLDIHTLPSCFHLITWLPSSIIPRYTYTSLLFPFHHMTSSLLYLDIHTLPYCFHLFTWLLPATLPLQYSGTSTVDPLTTLYTRNWVSLCSPAAEPTWDNFTFRQGIFCNVMTISLVFPRVALQALPLEIPILLSECTQMSPHRLTRED